jgi:hypothetical protein
MYISVELDDYRQSLQFCQIMVERTQLLMLRKQTSQMKRGGYLIYGTSHMHTGVINSTLYGQVMFNI